MSTVHKHSTDTVFDRQLQHGLRELDQLDATPDVSDKVTRMLATRPNVRRIPPSSRFTIAAALLGLAVTTALLVLPHIGNQQIESQDPRGAWRLTYQLPNDELRQWRRDQPTASVKQLIDDSVRSLQTRIGELGNVLRLDATQLAIDIDGASPASVSQVRRRVESSEDMAMRIMAEADYDTDGVRFDMELEGRRLRAWLDSGQRTRLLTDPTAINDYRATSQHLQWVVRCIRPNPARPGSWHYCYARAIAGPVLVNDEADLNQGKIPPHMQAKPVADRYLLELIPINMHEQHFGIADFDLGALAMTNGGDVMYQPRPNRRSAFIQWTGRLRGRYFAHIFDDRVLSMPSIQSRLPHFVGQYELATAETLISVLTTPVQVKPTLVSSKQRGSK